VLVLVLVPDGLVVGDGLVLGTVIFGFPVYGPSSSTGRNASLAVELTRLITSCGALPGTVTVIRSGPVCCTWAPELPVPFTRDSSTEMACCIEPADGAVSLMVAALSTTAVPLDRSSPRPTLNCLCQLLGLNVWEPVIPINMTRTSAPSTASARPGCEPLLLGGATCRLSLSGTVVPN
jgi:hypothetical protein